MRVASFAPRGACGAKATANWQEVAAPSGARQPLETMVKSAASGPPRVAALNPARGARLRALFERIAWDENQPRIKDP